DELLWILARGWQRRERLRGPVVGTLMTNYGLERALAGLGIDGNQWYYVDSPTGLGNAEGQGGNLWISKDHGVTWEWCDKDMATGTGRSGDSYTAVSKNGVIYYTDLYLSTASVDFSMDGGEMWIQNPLASVYPVVDRQWLMIGPDRSGGQMLYFSFNQLASGLVMVKSRMIGGAAIDWQPCNGGLPITSDVGSRDNFAVDQENGNIYHANYQSDGIYCYVSRDLADSFEAVKVHDETVHAKVQNTFIQIDVDNAGNVYMMWSSREHVMLGISTDEGASWTIRQVTESNGTRVLPWIAAGDEGRIAMAWYETNDMGNPNNLDDSIWDFVVAISVNALDEDPLYELITLDPGAHVGSVRTSGLDGDDGKTPDRDLGDYIGIDIDEFGRAIVVWGRDGDDGVNARQLPVMFARVDEGPFLFDLSLLADFAVRTDGLRVSVDASASVKGSDRPIVNHTWDWGDGTGGSGVAAEHRYVKGGVYNITLRVENDVGQVARAVITVSVRERPEWGFPLLAAGIGALLIAGTAVGLFAVKRVRRRGLDGPPR
ncbi:MAG TPA: PKD domain-containing protein, partial [Thermoplasmata archaeon]|nr:PKD domain-containing protein [Thermoplasmata archaeon]